MLTLFLLLPSTAGDLFVVSDGPCPISGNCVSSTGYPSVYTSSESCAITISRNVALTTGDDWALEVGYDHVIIRGQEYYHAENIPTQLGPGDKIFWHADSSVEKVGWEICFTEVTETGISRTSSTSMPSMAPTSIPSMAPTMVPGEYIAHSHAQCHVNTIQYPGDRHNNPIFGGGGFIGRYTGSDCARLCDDTSNRDGYGRRCVAFEHKSQDFNAEADCALAWGCDETKHWSGGRTYIKTTHKQSTDDCSCGATFQFPDGRAAHNSYPGLQKMALRRYLCHGRMCPSLHLLERFRLKNLDNGVIYPAKKWYETSSDWFYAKILDGNYNAGDRAWCICDQGRRLLNERKI